ncbi:MAG: nucleotidyltransferase [Bacteroides sp. SM23_62_1]|nr:MAG: nucleotidyltransferase [Bacteroides sp. SM23_62_1]
MAPTLLILAAGIGSRYGGMKQIDRVGPSGEAIIDYSIYDAIRAGFGKVVLIIRKNIEEEVREFFEHKLHGRIKMDFAYQEMDMIPPGISYPPERNKPWGTAHAIWVAASKINEPFVVINADDFYGRNSYMVVGGCMAEKGTTDHTNFCMIGYRLKNTLSDYGTVSRGLCVADDRSFLKSIVERPEIGKKNGDIYFRDNNSHEIPLTGEELVSMNIWGFTPVIFGLLEKRILEFIRINAGNIKAELYIPTAMNDIVQKGEASVRVLPVSDRWFGITYREDKPPAEENIRKLIRQGVYPENLWA